MSGESNRAQKYTGDDSDFWRRIPPSWIITDHNKNIRRPSSQAFQDSPDGSSMSVCLAELLLELGGDEKSMLEGHDGFSVVAITCGLAREKGQEILSDPLPGGPVEESHALVKGKKTDGVRKAFVRNARFVVDPEL